MKKFFIVTAFITGTQVLAQDTTLLTDVTVSANKFQTKTTETGKVVHIITRQEIEKAGARDLSQIINEQGGVYINGANSNPGKDKNIYVRGAKVEYTLITIDGIPVYDASGIGSNFDIRNIPLDQVERIEVLKGSQGTLYGSDAIAGVINIITRKPSKKLFQPYASFSAGSIEGRSKFDTRRWNAGISGRAQMIDYNIGFSRFFTKGLSEAAKSGTSVPDYEKDSYRQKGFTGKLGFQVNDKIRIQPHLRISVIDADLDQQPFVDENDFTARNKNLQTGIINTFAIGKSKLNLQYNFTRTSRDYTDDSTGTRNGYSTFANYLYESSEHYGEAFIVYPVKNWRITAGADIRRASADYYSKVVSPPFPPFPASIMETKQSSDSVKHNQFGVYTAAHFHSNTGFNIEGGGRLNLHSEYGSHFAFNVNPSILINDRIKLFTNASSGFKTPGLYQLYDDYIGNEDLKPEKSINLEAGVQVFTANKKGNVRGTYFRRKMEDVITYYYNPLTMKAYYINQDEQKDNGYELDASLQLSEKLNLKVFYSHIEGEVTTKLANGNDTTYSNLIRRPENNLNVHLGYQFTPKFFASTQVQAVGKSREQYFNSATFTVDDVTMDDYLLIHLYTEYTFNKNLKVFVDLRDITDKRYTEIYGYNSPGFQWNAGIRFVF